MDCDRGNFLRTERRCKQRVYGGPEIPCMRLQLFRLGCLEGPTSRKIGETWGTPIVFGFTKPARLGTDSIEITTPLRFALGLWADECVRRYTRLAWRPSPGMPDGLGNHRRVRGGRLRPWPSPGGPRLGRCLRS